MDLAATRTTALGGTAWWITLLVAAETERIRDLENRISERKYETYKPMLQMLGDMFNTFKISQLVANPEINSERFFRFHDLDNRVRFR